MSKPWDREMGFRAVVPAENGDAYEIVEAERGWCPLMNHECQIGPWFPYRWQVVEDVREHLEGQDE